MHFIHARDLTLEQNTMLLSHQLFTYLGYPSLATSSTLQESGFDGIGEYR